MYFATRTKNNLYMFLEYCSGGDLKKLLKESQKGYLPEQKLFNISPKL